MKLFEFDQHIGDWRVLVQSKDIQNGAIKSQHIADSAVTTINIGDGEVKSKNIADEAINADKIGNGEVKGRHIAPGAVNNEKLADECITGDEIEDDTVKNGKLANNAVSTRNIQDKNITEPKLGDESVPTRALQKESITPAKLSPSVTNEVILPIVNSIDDKYQTITDELYSMIASLQVGGIALSGQFGDRTDIGIHQKALTKAIGAILDELGELSGKTHIDFTLTVVPTFIAKEGTSSVTVTADCSESISDFDNIKLYINDELKAESHDTRVYTEALPISSDGESVIKAVGTILGKTITKQATVTKLFPFFMGSGQEYTDVMVPECQKELIGTLEGDYDVTIKHTGDYIFIIIPISKKDEFRRADMNGLGLKVEIPLNATEHEDYVVYQSANTYKAGTYNIDIDINS